MLNFGVHVICKSSICYVESAGTQVLWSPLANAATSIICRNQLTLLQKHQLTILNKLPLKEPHASSCNITPIERNTSSFFVVLTFLQPFRKAAPRNIIPICLLTETPENRIETQKAARHKTNSNSQRYNKRTAKNINPSLSQDPEYPGSSNSDNSR